MINQRSYKFVVLLCFILLALPAFAEKGGMPVYAYYGLAIGMFLLLSVISICLSLFFQFVIENLKKEKRKHIVFMTLGTLVFPVSYVYLEDKFNILYSFGIELKYGYETKFLVGKTTVIALTLLGFLIGYFITPKTDEIKLPTTKLKLH